MGHQIPTTHSFQLPNGQNVTLETGKLATQAHGSVLVRIGDTMMLATAVSNKEMKPDLDFFPLSVDYQEKFASAGRIPGNFFRRESRLNDYEILICRLVDRAIRPLFAKTYKSETQIIITLLSSDKETLPDAYAALAASAALTVSNIPFQGPISEVRVARIDGVFHVNPIRTELAKADLQIIVAASLDNIMMVEGEANECSEADLVDAIKFGHEAIKTQCHAQLELAKKFHGGEHAKREVPEAPADEEIAAKVRELAESKILEIASAGLNKDTRKAGFDAIKVSLKETFLEEKGGEYLAANTGLILSYFDKLKKETIRKMVLDTSIRLDGRKLDEVRPIWSEVNYLPATHGSALFNRGETQALASVTLGGKLDELMLDTAIQTTMERFILHYNFPAYSTGEVKPNRGPGRREIGHANLAARSLRRMFPDDLAYTIRIISDILESNGSSSMATVCAGSMALMDAGVQLKAPVAGIAMGMIAADGKHAILSDILGDEDALGDMDFKLTGTEKGICGCQMDIKIDGLPYEQLQKALEQAKAGRIHILSKMAESIAKPADDLKPHAPRIIEVVIEKSFIGAVIGPGGKIIQDIQKESGAVITIEERDEKGYIQIVSNNQEGIKKALARIDKITFVPKVGEDYDAVVATVMPYGVFVDFNGSSGLLHVSEMSYNRIDNVEDVYKEGDKVRIRVIEQDKKTGKFRLSSKVLLPKPEKN